MVQHYPRTAKNHYTQIQEAESVQLLYDFLHLPEHHMHHPMRYATSVVTCLSKLHPQSHTFSLVETITTLYYSKTMELGA
jgi:hypothetical protein